MTSTWTDEAIKILIEGFEAGGTATQVSNKLCDAGYVFNKYAVLGKSRRLKQTGLVLNVPKKTVQKTDASRWVDDPVTGSSKTLFEIGQNECRWPVAEKMYCGAVTEKNSSFCFIHNKRARSSH